MGDNRKTNSNYYCEACGVWMADHRSVRANHEGGVKHKANVAKKLNDMRKRSDREQKDRSAAERAMSTIEVTAQRRFEADKAAEEAHTLSQIGKWEHHAESGYYYNAVQRWYYDFKTKMYYGGDPAEWTNSPAMPRNARYDAQPAAGTHPRPSSSTPSEEAGRSTSSRPQQTVLPGMKAVAVHPLAGIGGYQMPDVGRIGGSKGVGIVYRAGAGARSEAAGAGGKRKRDGGGKPLSKEEIEFIAKREAARQRVQKRSMQTFGLG